MYDGVRVLTRLLGKPGNNSVPMRCRSTITAGPASGVTWRRVRNATGSGERRPTAACCGSRDAHSAMSMGHCQAVATVPAPWALRWRRDAPHYADLLRRVMDQAGRRVRQGETVPAVDKIVSLFEPHTDIVRNAGRDTLYGHRVNLATGRSGLVLATVTTATWTGCGRASRAASPGRLRQQRRERSRPCPLDNNGGESGTERYGPVPAEPRRSGRFERSVGRGNSSNDHGSPHARPALGRHARRTTAAPVKARPRRTRTARPRDPGLRSPNWRAGCTSNDAPSGPA